MISIGEYTYYKGKKIVRVSRSYWRMPGTWKTFTSLEDAKKFVDDADPDEFKNLTLV